METVDISASMRARKGKAASRRLRREGRVPSTFYGPKRSAISLELDAKEFASKVSDLEGSHLIRLSSQAPELSGRVALVREVQHHPVSGAVLHADLYEVDLAKKLSIKVPLHFVGKAIGVTQQGGILQPILREVEVECLPMDIPDYIEVDVSALGIHDTLHVGDLQAPAGAALRYETNDAVVTVLAPTVEQVKAEAEVEAVPEAAPQEAAKGPAPAAKPAA
jgi:large subunit ribosomal protein L25